MFSKDSYILSNNDVALLTATQHPDDFTLLFDDNLRSLSITGKPRFFATMGQPLTKTYALEHLFVPTYYTVLTQQLDKLDVMSTVRWTYEHALNTLQRIKTESYGTILRLVIQDIPQTPNTEIGHGDLLCRITSTGIIIHVNQTMATAWNTTANDLISTSFFRYCVEYEVPTLRHKLKNLTPNKPMFVMDIRMKNGYQPQKWVKWSFHGIFDLSGNIAEIQAVGYDITDHQRAQIAEQRQRNLAEAMRNISTVLNSSLELDMVLEHIIDIIHLVVAHDTVNVMLVDDQYASVVRANGYSNHNIRGITSLKLRIPRIHHLRYMYETQNEFVISDVDSYPEPCLGIPEFCWVKSYVGAPIVSDGQVIGFLNLESMTPRYFEAEHGELVRAFANHAAIAIRNAQLYEQAQRVAVVEERQRLARELHDAVSQTLFSANMIADALPMMWEKHPDGMFGQLRLLRQQTQLAMSELRSMLFELRPQTLADTQMRQLLEQLVQSYASRGLIDTSLVIEDNDQELALETKIVFYRIAQEAINNAIQHAHAKQIDVEYVMEDGQCRLLIRDDGQGFEVDAQRTGQMGLQIMQDRANSIGADFTLDSILNEGTTIQVIYNRTE